MTFDIKRMQENKIALRRKLANMPLEEKLAMLDVLRERALAVREAVGSKLHPVVREVPAKYRTGRKKDKDSKS